MTDGPLMLIPMAFASPGWIIGPFPTRSARNRVTPTGTATEPHPPRFGFMCMANRVSQLLVEHELSMLFLPVLNRNPRGPSGKGRLTLNAVALRSLWARKLLVWIPHMSITGKFLSCSGS